MECVEAEPIPALEPLPARVIGIAASAGGLEPLRRLVADLPADLDAAVCVVLHIPPTGRSLLAPILARHSALTTVVAEHGMRLRPGTIYVAPADQHLLVRADAVELSHGPTENGVRPAADPMFRSLARAWGSGAVAVVLSGALDDGAAGAAAVAEAGGNVIVQEPSEALVAGMPSSTLAVTTPDAAVPIAHMADALVRLPAGPVSSFTCPQCRGSLWEVREGETIRYHCPVGHAYSEEAMAEAQGHAVAGALWATVETLEQRGEGLRRIALRMERGQHFRDSASLADDRAAVIRRVLSGATG